jgi:hypothetical protein
MTTVLLLLILFVAGVVLFGCQADPGLRTEEVRPQDVQGIFTLILHGARHSDDLETLAVLDLEGDGYGFKVFAPDFDYRAKKGVPAEEALEEALRFVSFHSSFHRSRVSRIIDPQGRTIGYEVRPLYRITEYPISDPLDVHYGLSGADVTVRIRLSREVDLQRK